MRSEYRLWWLLLVGWHALLLCWYTGLHPLGWLGLNDGVSLLVTLAAWWLWAILLGTTWWVCLALSLASLSRLGRWAWCIIPFIWTWGLWLFEQWPLGLPWLSPGVWLGLLPFGAWVPEAVVTALAGLALTRWVQTRQRVTKPLARYHATRWLRLWTMGLCGLALLGGLLHLGQPVTAPQPVTVTTGRHAAWPVPIRIVQPNAPIPVIRGQHPLSTAQTVMSFLSASAAPEGTLWVLPEEGALPGIVPLVNPKAQAVFAQYQALADKRHWFMLIGTTTQAAESSTAASSPNATYNTLLLIQPASFPQVLHKRRLVPFGEVAPFGLDKFVQALAAYSPQFSTGSANQKPFRLRFNNHELTLWPMICSEALYADFWPPKGDKPHGMVVVAANLGWFQQRQNPGLAFWWQHVLRYRSQQTGWPVLSAANQGPSFYTGSGQ
jgi:apolipoprotein N-acyltransferase